MNDLTTEGMSAAELLSEAELPDLLQRCIGCLAELGEDFAASCDDLRTVQQRLAEGRFHLAVLGQFKRGKSTLLNALLGDDLLPTDILPVTAIPTFISFGPEITVRVYYTNQVQPTLITPTAEKSVIAILEDYVTESGNPQNQRQVERVEISHSSELLQQGVVLIDTPGIGSTLKHNTEVAHRILPQCDAALFLVSPDPPITEMELEYLGQIKQQLPRTFYLLNKVDFLDDRERLASLQFLTDQLGRFYTAAPQVMPISAREGLQSRLAGDQDRWQQSGMQLVEKSLIDFFAREKKQTLLQAMTRRTTDLVNDIVMQLQLSLSALKMPEDQLRQRVTQFRQSLPAIEREQQAAADVLAGDLKRAIELLGNEIEGLRDRAKLQILSKVEAHLDSVEDPEQMEKRVHETIAEEIDQFFSPAMRKVADVIRQEATGLLKINQERSNTLIEQVRQIAAELFEIPYQAPIAMSSYMPYKVPSWSNDLFTSDMDPLGQRFSRRFFSKKYRRRRTIKRLREESRKLLNQNVEQISWALRKSLDESFRQFAADLRDQLDKTIAATRKAMEVALKRSESHSRETAAREIQFKQALATLEEIQRELLP